MKRKIAGMILIATALVLTAFLVGHGIGAKNAQPVLHPAEVALEEPAASAESMVNLNTATCEELCALPGIGEKLAESILAYRQEHDGIRSVWELENVPGIGEGKLEKIIPLICTE